MSSSTKRSTGFLPVDGENLPGLGILPDLTDAQHVTRTKIARVVGHSIIGIQIESVYRKDWGGCNAPPGKRGGISISGLSVSLGNNIGRPIQTHCLQHVAPRRQRGNFVCTARVGMMCCVGGVLSQLVGAFCLHFNDGVAALLIATAPLYERTKTAGVAEHMVPQNSSANRPRIGRTSRSAATSSRVLRTPMQLSCLGSAKLLLLVQQQSPTHVSSCGCHIGG